MRGWIVQSWIVLLQRTQFWLEPNPDKGRHYKHVGVLEQMKQLFITELHNKHWHAQFAVYTQMKRDTSNSLKEVLQAAHLFEELSL
jgi:hypothetical protein